MKQEHQNNKNQALVGSLVDSKYYSMDTQHVAILPVVVFIHAIVLTAIVISSVWSIPYIMEHIPVFLITSPPPPPPPGGPSMNQDNSISTARPKLPKDFPPAKIPDYTPDTSPPPEDPTHNKDIGVPFSIDLGGNQDADIPDKPPAKNPPVPPIAESPPTHISPAIGIPPQVINRVQPDYPELAQKARIQGMVILEAVINKEGTVRSAQILRSDNPLLEQAAINAAMQWTFTPGKINGTTVAAYYTITIIFQLK